jgi:hypothetical protein
MALSFLDFLAGHDPDAVDPVVPRKKRLSKRAPGVTRGNAIELPGLAVTARRVSRAAEGLERTDRPTDLFPTDSAPLFDAGTGIAEAVEEHVVGPQYRPAVSRRTLLPEAPRDAVGFVPDPVVQRDVVGPFQGTDDEFEEGGERFDEAVRRRADFERQSPQMRGVERFAGGFTNGMFLGRLNQIEGALDPNRTAADYDAREAGLPAPTTAESVASLGGLLAGSFLPYGHASRALRSAGAKLAPETSAIVGSTRAGRMAQGAVENVGLGLLHRGALDDPDIGRHAMLNAAIGGAFGAAMRPRTPPPPRQRPRQPRDIRFEQYMDDALGVTPKRVAPTEELLTLPEGDLTSFSPGRTYATRTPRPAATPTPPQPPSPTESATAVPPLDDVLDPLRRAADLAPEAPRPRRVEPMGDDVTEFRQRSMDGTEPERVVSAVVRINGKEFDGLNHALARDAAVDAGVPGVYDAPELHESLFRTSTGRVVGRVEAAEIGRAARQLTQEPRRRMGLGAEDLIRSPEERLALGEAQRRAQAEWERLTNRANSEARGAEGTAALRPVTSLAGAGLGAAVGAAADDENRARGAVLGGAAGLVGGAALPSVASRLVRGAAGTAGDDGRLYAAFRTRDGQVFAGLHHEEAAARAYQRTGLHPDQLEEGFATADNQFVDSETAYRMADERGMLDEAKVAAPQEEAGGNFMRTNAAGERVPAPRGPGVLRSEFLRETPDAPLLDRIRGITDNEIGSTSPGEVRKAMRRRDVPRAFGGGVPRDLKTLSQRRAWIYGMEAGQEGVERGVLTTKYAEGTPEWRAAQRGWNATRPRESRARAPATVESTPELKAIRLRDGAVVTGENHGIAVNNAVERGLLPRDFDNLSDAVWPNYFEEGLATADGSFVPRAPRGTTAATPGGYVAEPTTRGRFKVWNPETGHVAEEAIGGVGAQRTARDIARRLSAPVRGQAGAVDPRLVGGIAKAGVSTAVGGAAGGVLDRENPTRGAIGGALTGAALGSGWLMPRRPTSVGTPPPVRSGFRQRAATAWKAGLLTGLKTHEVNIASNFGLAAAEAAKDTPAALGDAVLSGVLNNRVVQKRLGLDTARSPARTKGGSAYPALAGGAVGAVAGGSQGDSLRERARNAAFGATAGATTVGLARALNPASWRGARQGLRDAREVWSGRAPSTAHERFEVKETHFDNVILDTAYRYVFRALGAEDAFFRAIATDRSLREQASAFARSQGLRGSRRAADAMYAILKADDSAIDPAFLQRYGPEIQGMRLRAAADADVATFQDETALGAAAQAFGKIPVVGTIAVPFGKTPGAVATRLVEYSPAGFVISAVQTNRLVRALKDGAPNPEAAALLQRYASEAFGRAVTGTAVIGLGYVLGRLGMATTTFPADGVLRDQWQQDNKQENSIYLGGQWVEFGRLAPLGNLIGIGAGLAARDHGGVGDFMQDAALTTAESALDQEFLFGAHDMVESLVAERRSREHATRTGEPREPNSAANRYVQNLSGSIVPAAAGALSRGLDTTTPQPEAVDLPFVGSDHGAIDAIRSRIPGLSRQVGNKVNPFGRDVQRQPINEVLPTRMSKDKRDDPLVRELNNLGVIVQPVARTRGETTQRHRERQRRTGQAIASVLSAMFTDEVGDNEFHRQMEGETAREFMDRQKRLQVHFRRYQDAEASVQAAARFAQTYRPTRAGDVSEAQEEAYDALKEMVGGAQDARRLVTAMREGRPAEEVIAERRKKAVEDAVSMIRRSYNARMRQKTPARRN